ncbi:hypothetical protein [Stackebrandtia nassauensis]|uniref:Uncharacterized protein n=1 Tax=Stackebrandtia nassauensis (strain DSM 44728 / CIP 108903 / NRRL B-16338 / NBRC 102104 / LLR-40K-21) TaxID=446470 RepID=D3QA01_STANL|nr:hypothetical protein [Stackebrandtia nassauensis]ADD40713.1 hypothetical protein Snas_1003 [Stackebrandtia nassauensis DSM 44728]
MNDNQDIRFDTTNVRGFAEYMHHLLTTKYEERARTISTKLAGGEGGGGDDRAYSTSGGSMGSSGVEYDGLQVGKTEVTNALVGEKVLKQFMRAWAGMANAAAYAAEEYSGQDGENATDLQGDFTPGEERVATQQGPLPQQ